MLGAAAGGQRLHADTGRLTVCPESAALAQLRQSDSVRVWIARVTRMRVSQSMRSVRTLRAL